MARINVFTVLIGLLSLFITQTAAQNVKIMALGASIVGAPGCWRAYLWKKLEDAGITNIHFVGSLPAPDCGFTYDGDNEGHAGILATEIVSKNLLPGWLNASRPDIILMHLGTNDVIQKKTPEQTIAAFSTLVDQMRKSKPTMQVLISQLIPIRPDKFPPASTGIVALNQAMATWAPTKNTTESPIFLINAFTGFNATADTRDGEHPNDTGDHILANDYYPFVVKAIQNVDDGQQTYGTARRAVSWAA